MFDLVACQLVIKQILDIIDTIVPAEMKMSAQLKTLTLAPILPLAIEKPPALIDMKFEHASPR
ncbi:MAG: hypothetical protein GPOALKHO_000451 [Sodalis sp.]|nr:MAG: hypothetical protein GPOALKHO_000451 [Sodalis sp.]